MTRLFPNRLQGKRPIGALAATLLASFWIGCASSPSEDCERIPNFGLRCTVIAVPDPGTFKSAGVTTFLERRCGTLDCHGQKGRALRVYGLNGLRAPREGGVDTAAPTTDEEIASNFRSLVSLEPEELSRVVRTGQNADRLLLIQKAIGYDPDSPIPEQEGVQHKGGRVINRGFSDEGYRCLVSWIGNKPDPDACTAAANAY